MDKLKAAQRMLGFHTGGYVSKLPPSVTVRYVIDDSESQPGQASPFVDFDKAARDLDKLGGLIDMKRSRISPAFWNMEVEIERKEAVIVELQRLLDEKDAEIDRLLEPAKWWRMLGWAILTGTVLGVIAGAYEVIT